MIVKKFEEFNPVLKLQVQDYVEIKMRSGDMKEIFDAVGEKIPKGLTSGESEEIFDKVKEKAIEFYQKFPEHMRTGKGLAIGGIPVRSNRIVPSLANIGGTGKR